MHKIIKIILVALGALGAILWFMLPEGTMPVAEASQSTSMSLMFVTTYVLLGIAIAASLFYSLKNLFATPASLKKSLISIGGFLLVVVVSYILASGTDVDLAEMAKKGIPTTEGTVKTIGMGLNVFYVLTIVAVALMLWPGVRKIFTKQ